VTLSVDGLESHLKWIKDIEEVQNVTLQYPIIADENKEVANLYDMSPIMQMIASFVPFYIMEKSKTILFIRHLLVEILMKFCV
jgi:alkyl hydroperoxide reductase subunit AhpC